MDQEQSEKLSWGTVTIAVYNQTCQENNVAFPFLFCVLFLLSQDLKKLRRIRKWQLLRRSYYCRYAEGEKSHSGKISWRGTVDSREILNLGSNTWIDWVQTCRQLWHCFLSHFLELTDTPRLGITLSNRTCAAFVSGNKKFCCCLSASWGR